MPELTGDQSIDLRGIFCPMNFVHSKLRLEEMALGAVLEIIVDDEEAVTHVPRTFELQGQCVVGVSKLPDGAYRLLIRKEAD